MCVGVRGRECAYVRVKQTMTITAYMYAYMRVEYILKHGNTRRGRAGVKSTAEVVCPILWQGVPEDSMPPQVPQCRLCAHGTGPAKLDRGTRRRGISHLKSVRSLTEDGAVGERAAQPVHGARLVDVQVCAGHVHVVPDPG